MALADPAVHRLTTAEYDRLVAAGALEDMRVELLEGLLVDMTPQGTEHAALVLALTRWLGRRIDLLRVQMPLACAEGWQPEPDVALAPATPPNEHARTAQLVVEVVVTARAEAQHKLPGYARAGVPIVWLVDVPARAVERLSAPRGDGYAERVVLRADDLLDPRVEGIQPRTVATLFADAGLA